MPMTLVSGTTGGGGRRLHMSQRRHSLGGSGGDGYSSDEEGLERGVSTPAAGATATSSYAPSSRPRRHRQPSQSSLLARLRRSPFANWKLWAVAKLTGLFLVLLLYGASSPPGPTKHEAANAATAAATTAATMKEAGGGAKPTPSVWHHGYRMIQDGFHQLRQGWNQKQPQKQAPPHQSVSLAGPQRTLCAPPKKPAHHETPHNRAFLLGGQTFDRVPPPKPGSLQPRGVVISASGTVRRLAVGAYITAYLVRRVFHSDLPIEIYHVSDREVFDPTLKAQLEALGDVRVLDLVTALQDRFRDVLAAEAGAAEQRTTTTTTMTGAATTTSAKDVAGAGGVRDKEEDGNGALSGHLSYLRPSIEQLASYAAKPYAVLASSFEEVLLFDAGAIPFTDADAFFTLEDYKQAGVMVFRDYVPSAPHKWDWIPEEFCVDTDAVLAYFQGTEGDSSCVVFDKARNWDALLVTAVLNGPLQHITYQKLNGDKDTWIMAMIYMRSHLQPLHTVPGFLFVDYEGNFVARKVHGQLQMLKVDKAPEPRQGKAQDPPPGSDEGLLVPLFYNNQLFNFTQWKWNKGWTYVGSYDDYGSLYNPPTSLSTDCRPVPVEYLDPLTRVMETAFDGVVAALKEIGSDHCGCRDDWPTACVTFVY